MKELAESLEAVFILNNYEWKIGGDLSIPTAEDIEKVLIHAKNVLDNQEGDEVQLEVGRLLFKKRGKHLDVFVMYGELE